MTLEGYSVAVRDSTTLYNIFVKGLRRNVYS